MVAKLTTLTSDFVLFHSIFYRQQACQTEHV